MKKTLYILLQCTWGILVTLIGAVFFLFNRNCEHQWYRCCIDTKWNAKGGMSLGLFIFTPADDAPYVQMIRVHEYGHTIQNIVLGPLMLLAGAVSVVWGNHPYFARKRSKGVPYTACCVEAWASKWGETVSGETAIR